jgi:hypothetical protein
MISSQDECKPFSVPTAEEANASQRQPFPSNSPAFYLADPSSDVLEIKALDFTIDPRKRQLSLGTTASSCCCGKVVVTNSLQSPHRLRAISSGLHLDLQGEIKKAIGLKPRIHISVYLNGQPSPTVEWALCASARLEISQ